MAESIIAELQREALDRKVPIADLLRKALVVAKKLKIEEFAAWVTHELNGYSDTKDIPQYRWIGGTVKAWNPFQGWIPVMFQDYKEQEILSKRPCGMAIAEIESLVEKNASGESLHMPFSPYIEQHLRKGIKWDTEVTLVVPATMLVRIIDATRTVVLNWAMKLEEDGITGVGLSFSDKEKRVAGKSSYAINNFYGPITNSQIQQQTSDSIQVSISDELDMRAIEGILEAVKKYLQNEVLSTAARQEIEAEMKTVQAQTESPRPKMNIIRESLASIRSILEGMAASLLTAELIALIQRALGR